jgi:hypothetical protein
MQVAIRAGHSLQIDLPTDASRPEAWTKLQNEYPEETKIFRQRLEKTRVITQRGMFVALGMNRNPSRPKQ